MPEGQEKIIEMARQVSLKAHAPYSSFAVGAVLVADDGSLYPACNVENASYGATICAERAAVCAAVADGHKNFREVVIYTETDEPTSPCGICRQFLMDFSPRMTVTCACKTGKVLQRSLAELLPEAFTEPQLDK